jgi:hypothetical protein
MPSIIQNQFEPFALTFGKTRRLAKVLENCPLTDRAFFNRYAVETIQEKLASLDL